MKMMVKLAVLFATLLVITGMAFADDCYNVIGTQVDDPNSTFTGLASVNLDYENKKGMVCTDIPPVGDLSLSLFIESHFLNEQALAYNENCAGFIKGHGRDNNVITGIITCYGERYTVWGHKTDEGCPACSGGAVAP